MEDEAGFDRTVAAIASTWEVWVEVGQGLDESRWRAATRCPGWDVASVYAHVSMFPVVLAGPLPDGADDPRSARVTAVDILRGFNEPGGVAQTMADTVGDTAVRDAAAHPFEVLVSRFSGEGTEALARMRATEPSTVIRWPGTDGVTTVAEGLRIVLMESVVHLLDVLRALELPPGIPDPALRETVRLLAEIAPAVEFVEAATGRSESRPLPVLR